MGSLSKTPNYGGSGIKWLMGGKLNQSLLLLKKTQLLPFRKKFK